MKLDLQMIDSVLVPTQAWGSSQEAAVQRPYYRVCVVFGVRVKLGLHHLPGV